MSQKAKDVSKRTFDPKAFDRLVAQMGKLYKQFIAETKSESCLVAPNDHIVGPIGEWRAIQLIKASMGLKARRVSDSPRDPDDLMVEYLGNTHYISVKTTTEHSATGVSGLVKFEERAKWEWLVCVRLDHDLQLLHHFWMTRADARHLFIKGDGGARHFRWLDAVQMDGIHEFPDWFLDRKGRRKKAA